MLQHIINAIVEYVSQFGYPGIVALMFLESSFFPFPSEIVMIPAGYLAYTGEMHLMLVISMGIIGSILGALFNYALAHYVGRPFLHRFAKYFLMNESRLTRVELYFKSHGEISTFVGRLIPGVRQYISFPAGLARMSLARFCFFTGLGAGIWVTILTFIGYTVGYNSELIKSYTQQWALYLMIGAAVIISLYLIIHNRPAKSKITVSSTQKIKHDIL